MGAVILIAVIVLMTIPGSLAFGLTIKEEKDLSKEYMKILRQYFKFIEDPVIADYVNQIGQKILQILTRRGRRTLNLVWFGIAL